MLRTSLVRIPGMDWLRFRNVAEEGLHGGVAAAVREIRFRQRVDEIYLWSTNHHRLVVAGTAAIVRVYLLILGTSKL